MKYLFFALYWFGTTNQVETRPFNTYEECSSYMDAVIDHLKDRQKLSSFVTWEISCHSIPTKD